MNESLSLTIILQQELQQRKSRNAGYSLRSFARTLGLSSSFLSKLMSGKKSVSEETLLKISSRLGLSEETIQKLQVQLPRFKLEQHAFEPIDLDQFQMISDWHHFAILEAITLSDFEPNAEWLAGRLGLTIERTRLAVERLARMGYLALDEDGKILNQVGSHTTVGAGGLTLAQREHERQILGLAQQALDQTPAEFRSQSSVTLAIPQSRLPEAKERIKEFRREMTALLQRKGKRDSVYNLSISFFPTTQIKNVQNVQKKEKV